MAKNKRPILTVLVILGVIALVLGTSMILFLKMVDPSAELSFSDRIGVIPIDGAITDAHEITSQLIRFRKDKRIKAIVLRINSPGGAVGPTQEIYREIRKTVETKSVVASLGGVAASGGYYIAAATDKIVANPGTITGSIGVLMEFMRFEDLLEKIGIKLEVLKSGEFKDIGSPHRELTKRDREIIDSLIADIQGQFVKAVANGRDLPLEKVNQIADGRVFSGARAKELDLVDVLGNFQDAVDVAKGMADIEGDAILVYPRKKRMELWESFVKGTARSVSEVFQGIKPRLEYKWGGFYASP
ncbi:MAG: signal peptide peptidase SppA [Deltaproteobacteria bacterium]|nr:signal peptide peptidase SppA [Deltaproteobacteria bacterium]MBW2143510.1 signal peptide peptidase SppA [Deltaproteobacteria bacterium]